MVEDDEVTIRSLRYLLEHYGYAVYAARSLREAIDLLKIEPQIILLDLNLPDGDGTRVLEHLKIRKMTSRVAVVTAEMDHDRLKRVQTFGPQMLLHKPLNFLNLLEQLRASAA